MKTWPDKQVQSAAHDAGGLSGSHRLARVFVAGCG
jgi:hypothetical protein